jgi:hypothetical protein
MKERNKYNLAIIELKKYLIGIKLNKKYCNYIFLKIRKREYEILYKKFKYFGTNLVYIKSIEIYDYKSLLKKYRIKKNDILRKINFINNICKINDKIKKHKAIKLIGPISIENIITYKKFYEKYLNLFIDLDNNMAKEIDKLKDSKEYICNELQNDHFGLGLYIRNNYIYKMNYNVEYIFGEYARIFADDISSNVLNGYRFYKLGIFDIFK